MASQDIWLTRDGHQKLFQQLQRLKAVRRREIAADLERARAHGDLRENAEFDAAKEAQAQNERQIAELEQTLTHARLLDETDLPSDRAYLGTTVTLHDPQATAEVEYTLVSAPEADPPAGKISIESPIGRGLLGRAVGETVSITVPRGTLSLRIVNIRRG